MTGRVADAALLDTHVLLWYTLSPEKLSRTASDIRRRDHRIYVSAITAWEIGIKVRLGKLGEARSLHEHYHQRLAQYGFLELPFTSVHALAAGSLESDHKDPFDRALSAQAASEQLTIITRDGALAGLPGTRVLW